MMPCSRFKHGAVPLIVFLLAILFYFRPYCPESAEHDVFLNFKGEDVRNKFVSHLHAALHQNFIKVFIDDNNLERGESVEPALLDAIANSMLVIIVFSKNYANSTYCLNELVKIIECHAYRKTAIPIFYEINPSDVGNQSGVFAQAFTEHEENFKYSDQVFRWRLALTIAANLVGWDSENIKPEAKLIREVVNEVSGKLALRTSCAAREKITQAAVYGLLFALPFVIFKWPADDDQNPEKLKCYDVFVNYCNEETLVSELYDALDKQKRQIFKDKGFGRGAGFTKEMKEAIEHSKFAIIVFTKFSARSPVFLDALAKVMERQRCRQIQVIPVYYYVDPSNLSWWEESFAMHEKRWGWKEKVKAWNDAAERVHKLTTGNGKRRRKETNIDAVVRNVMKEMG